MGRGDSADTIGTAAALGCQVVGVHPGQDLSTALYQDLGRREPPDEVTILDEPTGSSRATRPPTWRPPARGGRSTSSWLQRRTGALDIRLRIAWPWPSPTVAAAIMVGGVFTGVTPRLSPALAGLLGVALCLRRQSRLRRKAFLTNLLIAVGLFAIGLLVTVPGFGNVMCAAAGLGSAAGDAGDFLRPPVPFSDGWKIIEAWLMGIVGFGAGWIALPVRRPSIGLLLPLPVAAIAGISVPKDAQIVSGLAVLVLFAIGLGLLSSEQSTGDDARPSAAYEMRKAVRAVPLLAALTVGLYFLAHHASFLFPKAIIDPAQQPQRPKTVPLSAVEDRVLFTVESTLQGPWRIGSLDVYDGNDLALARPLPRTLDPSPHQRRGQHRLRGRQRARRRRRHVHGHRPPAAPSCPGLPNTVGIRATGPELSYMTPANEQHPRGAGSQVTSGSSLHRGGGAPKPARSSDLKAIGDNEFKPIAGNIQQFVPVPDPRRPPAATRRWSTRAPTTNKWARIRLPLFTYTLHDVTAAGAGTPRRDHAPPGKVRTWWPGPGGARPSRSSPPRPCWPAGPVFPPASAYGFRRRPDRRTARDPASQRRQLRRGLHFPSKVATGHRPAEGPTTLSSDPGVAAPRGGHQAQQRHLCPALSAHVHASAQRARASKSRWGS